MTDDYLEWPDASEAYEERIADLEAERCAALARLRKCYEVLREVDDRRRPMETCSVCGAVYIKRRGVRAPPSHHADCRLADLLSELWKPLVGGDDT